MCGKKGPSAGEQKQMQLDEEARLQAKANQEKATALAATLLNKRNIALHNAKLKLSSTSNRTLLAPYFSREPTSPTEQLGGY